MTHLLALSYGKDSCACPHVIVDVLGWPLDGAVHAEVWATDTISADLPPMVSFKARFDAYVRQKYHIEIEHKRADTTYERCFYSKVGEQGRKCQEKRKGQIYGFPVRVGPWCNSRLKLSVLPKDEGHSMWYLGISADEPERIERYINRPGIKLPLVEAGWTEAMCREWCADNGLLSPIYTTAARGGCWFCHNQGVDQLRSLRREYPEYWALMLKWDADSPMAFKAPSKKGEQGHTVHDFERRFQLEDDGLIFPYDKVFRWAMLDQELNYRWF